VFTEQLTQRYAIGQPIFPQTANNNTKQTLAIDLEFSRRAFFLLMIGNVTAGGSINAKLQDSSDNSVWADLATDAPTLNNISLTGLTTTGRQYTFEVKASQVPKRYVRLSVTETGGFNVIVACACWGEEGNHKPDNAQNDASVITQQVASF
jgi:hypothetical protein